METGGAILAIFDTYKETAWLAKRHCQPKSTRQRGTVPQAGKYSQIAHLHA